MAESLKGNYWNGRADSSLQVTAELFFLALLSHFFRLWLFSTVAAVLAAIGLRAREFYHLNVLSLKTRGPALPLKAALFWHPSSLGCGKNPCLELEAADAVNILHQSPEKASETNVPQRAFSPFISIRGVFSSTRVQQWQPNQLATSCQFTLEKIQFYLWWTVEWGITNCKWMKTEPGCKNRQAI